MSSVLRTGRVVLREFTQADLDVLAAIMADKEQMSLYPRPGTRAETEEWIDRTIDLYEHRGFRFLVDGIWRRFRVPRLLRYQT
ncbi:MAG: GNAT family N-acetyltransferase, partial [Candidatus Limnocylindria bacterium]